MKRLACVPAPGILKMWPGFIVVFTQNVAESIQFASGFRASPAFGRHQSRSGAGRVLRWPGSRIRFMPDLQRRLAGLPDTRHTWLDSFDGVPRALRSVSSHARNQSTTMRNPSSMRLILSNDCRPAAFLNRHMLRTGTNRSRSARRICEISFRRERSPGAGGDRIFVSAREP